MKLGSWPFPRQYRKVLKKEDKNFATFFHGAKSALMKSVQGNMNGMSKQLCCWVASLYDELLDDRTILSSVVKSDDVDGVSSEAGVSSEERAPENGNAKMTIREVYDEVQRLGFGCESLESFVYDACTLRSEFLSCSQEL